MNGILSVCMCVLAFQNHHTLLKWNILSLLVYEQAIRQNISLWEGVLVMEGQYIHMSRERNSFETEYSWPKHTYIHMSKEREKQVDFMPFNCEEDHVVYDLPLQNSELLLRHSQRSLKARQTLCVTGFLQLFISNQIDWVQIWVSGCQVFSEHLNSNAVFKLFILIWSYEGMKVMNFGYWNSYEYFTITPICHISSRFS